MENTTCRCAIKVNNFTTLLFHFIYTCIYAWIRMCVYKVALCELGTNAKATNHSGQNFSKSLT